MLTALLLFAHLAALSLATYPVTDASGLGDALAGFGAISGGGGCSRFLIEYPEPSRTAVLDYLFTPSFGASLHGLKLEIGGDADSTNGAEASYSRFEGEADFSRGYEVWLAQEAKKRNPNIILYGLPWTWPHYLAGSTEEAGDGRGNPWTNLTKTASYVTGWVAGMQANFNLTIDYVGLWNEVGCSCPPAAACPANPRTPHALSPLLPLSLTQTTYPTSPCSAPLLTPRGFQKP